MVRGAKVKLKSGGPIMTVRAIDGESVECVWFDRATPRKETFFADMLEEDDDEDVGELLERLKNEKKDEAP